MSGFPEEEVLNFLHRMTYVPGVVRVFDSGHAKDDDGNPIKEDHPFKGPQELFQILFADKGNPLSSCTSVYQFLRVMHDALSAQINMTGAVGVLHRNITDQTIQVKDCNQNPIAVGDDRYKPKMLIAPYIKEILGEVKPEDNANQLAECLITDFEDSVVFIPGLHEEALKKTIGTPIFLSRSVARAALLPVERTMIFPSIPRLEGKNNLFRKYRLAKEKPHDYLSYNNFSDRAFILHVNNKGDLKGKGKGKGKSVDPPSFKHSFVHEAESTLWVITSWLIHAIPVACTCPADGHPPLDPKGYVSSEAYRHICTLLYLDPPESRDLIPAASEWCKFIHPQLPSSLATMLAEMHRYLRPEWALFPAENLRPDHAHEALRRLVYKEIVRMKDAGEVGEVQRARRAVPHDILKKVRKQEEHVDLMAMFGKPVNPLGRFMGIRPMPGDSKEDVGYEGPVYLDDDDDEDEDGDEDEDRDRDREEGIDQGAFKAAGSLPSDEPAQSQALASGEDKMDTD
ncbi:hypothetical protein BDV93DRAFT_525631 [Ceratobasidium sp. AG-I]|nr:hypothetical protein BDV93DRAFT_525631 [Ceratobasidium sp. AG-I]